MTTKKLLADTKFEPPKISRRERDLEKARMQGFAQAMYEVEINKKEKIDHAAIEMLHQIAGMAEANTRLTMQIVECLKICRIDGNKL